MADHGAVMMMVEEEEEEARSSAKPSHFSISPLLRVRVWPTSPH